MPPSPKWASVFLEMHPEHGARIELKLTRAEERCVEYALSFASAGASFTGSAEIELEDGKVRFSVLSPAPPAWLLDVARALLRTLYRNHRETGGWPRRLTRWRAEPSGTSP